MLERSLIFARISLGRNLSVQFIFFRHLYLHSITNVHVETLRDILIDELHNHLYLKSFWCESRWATYTVGQQSSKPLSIAPSRLTIPVSSES
jgi:hypothetical protein